ncbi:MAG: hypothetical protein DDT26_02601 [Dehalococcoidia bacterium]|nr:hypothetical protein [Chloroflexota bacterium]
MCAERRPFKVRTFLNYVQIYPTQPTLDVLKVGGRSVSAAMFARAPMPRNARLCASYVSATRRRGRAAADADDVDDRPIILSSFPHIERKEG